MAFSGSPTNEGYGGLTPRSVMMMGDNAGTPTPITVNSSGQQIVNAVNLATAPFSTVSVGTSATPLVSGVDSTRKTLMLFNNGASTVYFGPSSSVTTSLYSFSLGAGQGMVLEKSDSLARFRWYGIVATGTNNVQVTEGKE